MPRRGFVAIAGRPNTGKSTLLNSLARRKLSIVSPVPQTTRHPTRFVLNHGNAQLVLVDLPGFAKPKTLMGRRPNEAVTAVTADSDTVVMLVDARAGVGGGDAYLAKKLLGLEIPVVCAVNKSDVSTKEQVAAALEAMGRISSECEAEGRSAFADFVPISAKTGSGIDTLLDVVAGLLPKGTHLFSQDELPLEDESLELETRMAEIIREKLIATAREELPYSIAVDIDDVSTREKDGAELVEVSAKVLVERESQKAIVVGAAGEGIKRAGTRARVELEHVLGARVFLDLRVVVAKDWQKNPKTLEKLGL